MIREVKFESQDRRIKQIIAALNKHGIKDIEEAIGLPNDEENDDMLNQDSSSVLGDPVTTV